MSNKPELNLDALRHASEKGCAVAVSGGSDSLALLELLLESDMPIHALTVDHGLRAESRDEAQFVAAYCTKRGCPHVILSVNVSKQGNLQAAARHVRYDALKAWCVANHIEVLALGHTADDQAETLLMNAFRGSGVDGLAAMSEEYGTHPKIVRPMLALRRKHLREYLTKKGIKWVDDPSNNDTKFDRVRMRQWLHDGEAMGFDMSGLLRTQSNMARVRRHLTAQTNIWMAKNVKMQRYNIEAQIDRAAILAVGDEASLRILAKLCQYFGGGEYRPRMDALGTLLSALKFGKSETGGMTLARTDFHWSKHKLRICAEPKHLPAASTDNNWHHYQLNLAINRDYALGSLGDDATKQHDHWREWGVSARAAFALPCLRQGGQVIAIAGDGQFDAAWISANPPFVKE